MVFKKPMCSLPEVGGLGGGGEGSVSTVTWHWKKRPVVSPGFSLSTAPQQGRSLERPHNQEYPGEPGSQRMPGHEPREQGVSDCRSWHSKALESEGPGPSWSQPFTGLSATCRNALAPGASAVPSAEWGEDVSITRCPEDFMGQHVKASTRCPDTSRCSRT